MDEAWSTSERRLIAKAARTFTPLSGSFELLPLCNMNCKMCYVRLDRVQMEAQGRMRTGEEWLSLAKQLKKAGILFLILTGGEPLLHPQFREIYTGVRNLGIVVTVNTNGTLIDEAWADFFAKYPPRRINVTLYGASEETYETLCGYKKGYEKALHAIALLRKRGIAVKINGSLVRANESDIDEITKKAKELDAAVNIDTYMYPAKRERDKPFDLQSRLGPKEAAMARVHFLEMSLPKEYFMAMREQTLYAAKHTKEGEEKPWPMRCQAGRSSFTINWQGRMRPCVMLANPSLPVFEIGFEKAWEQLTGEMKKVTMSPKCSACTLRNICSTCPACALYEAGDFKEVPQYMCEYTKGIVEAYEQGEKIVK